MTSTYLKLMAGSRLSNYMGLKLDAGTALKCGERYMYIEIPVARAELDGEATDVVKRNQHVFIVPACTVNVRGESIVDVEPNSELAELGTVQAGYKIHSQSGEKRPGFWFTARKDVDVASISHAVRLYMYNI